MPTTTRTIEGKDQDGRPATVTVTVDEPARPARPARSPMVIGATVKAQDFARLAPGGPLHGARFCRTFSSAGDRILPRTHPRRRLPAGVCEMHSLKDWLGDTAMIDLIRADLDAMPPELLDGPPLLPELRPYDPHGYSDGQAESDGFSYLLCWCHEGENNMIAQGVSPKEWRRRHRLAYRTIRQHRNGHRVGYIPTQNLIWTESASVPSKPKGDGDVLTWWAGVGDYAGIDVYARSIVDRVATAGLYRPPDDILRLVWELAHAAGRRPFLPELGVILQGRPGAADTGQHRAAWIRRVLSALESGGAVAAAWWDELGANDRDFRLTDPLSLDAWAEAIRTHPPTTI